MAITRLGFCGPLGDSALITAHDPAAMSTGYLLLQGVGVWLVTLLYWR